MTLIHRSAEFNKADLLTVEAVLKYPNMKTLRNSQPVEIKGSEFVSSVVVKNTVSGVQSEIPTAGVFVEIGMLPSTNFVKGLVELDEFNRIKVNAKNQHTSVDGIWAAGDCTDRVVSPKQYCGRRRSQSSGRHLFLAQGE